MMWWVDGKEKDMITCLFMDPLPLRKEQRSMAWMESRLTKSSKKIRHLLKTASAEALSGAALENISSQSFKLLLTKLIAVTLEEGMLQLTKLDQATGGLEDREILIPLISKVIRPLTLLIWWQHLCHQLASQMQPQIILPIRAARHSSRCKDLQQALVD